MGVYYVTFVFGLIRAGLSRVGLRAKSGVFGACSLWFPRLTTLAFAWTALYLIPRLFGVSVGSSGMYQPDLVLAMVADRGDGRRMDGFQAYSGKRPLINRLLKQACLPL